MSDERPHPPATFPDPASGGRAEPDETGDDLLAARRGDSAAARRIVARHGPSMVRTAWRVLGAYGPREADDVVQEAMIAALTTRALPTADAGAWLRAITARKALDFLRRRQRRAEEPLPDTAREAEAPAAPPSRESAEVATLRQTMRRLKPIDRAVLVLTDLEGRSMREAAGMLGLTHVAIRLRASRARRKLARMLREAGFEGRRR